MITGVYSAMTAMDASASQHEVIAQNLAHAQMPGYRRIAVRHQSFEAALDEEQRAAYSRESMGTGDIDRVIDFTQGTMERTERTLDFAIHGDGFFVVDGPAGETLYTRNGSFHLNGDGELVTAEGLTVRGENGIINVPPNVDVSSLALQSDGTIVAGDQQIVGSTLSGFKTPACSNGVASPCSKLRPRSTRNRMASPSFRESANVRTCMSSMNSSG